MKAEFPLSRADVVAASEAASFELPELDRNTYTRDQFFGEVVGRVPSLEVVEVHKRRVRYLIDGCMAEMTTLGVRDWSSQTVAAESSDPAAVRRVVASLGLGAHVNTSYTQGLKRIIGEIPARYAVIDIGTNSVKFHIGEKPLDGDWVRVVDRAEVTRLGEGMADGGQIQPEPLERTTRAVIAMVDEARAHDVAAIAAVGTAALRNATNATFAVESISQRAGVPIEVVSGEEESRLAYVAVTAGVGLSDGPVVVFDTGGGSSQFTFGVGSEVEERFSLNVGAVSYTERFGLDGKVSEETIEAARQALAADLERIQARGPGALIGMGGAVTNLTAVSLGLTEYDPDRVQGARLEAAEVDRQIEQYRGLDSAERKSIVGLQANRAPVILAGALIVRSVMEALGCDFLVVSDRGLRHGLPRERFGMARSGSDG
jgi:exopolyphosphatase/guanosine-5'-triphosphate,3'-diphosphate pyrophosphatase